MSSTTIDPISPSTAANDKTALPEDIIEKQSEMTSTPQFVVFVFFVLGLSMAVYNGTWTLALGMGTSILIIYLLFRTFFQRFIPYGTSLCLGLLSSQLVFQMQEVSHFNIIFFIATASLMLYHNAKVLLPIILVFTFHHIFFYLRVASKEEFSNYSLVIPYILLFTVQVIMSIAYLVRLQKLVESKTTLEEKYTTQHVNLEQNINYAKQIASGDFDTSFNVSNEDVLGQSLHEMSKNLKAAAEENKNRNWTMAGIAKIAEIIRVSNHNMEDLANQLISYLVKYLNATQGGLFVLNGTDSENKFLELKGCYAYDRRKYLEKKVDLGEGLIGQSVLEKETIYLTDVPQNYLSITSGLGEANPKALIIVPLKTEDDIVGALEIASFQKFEPYQREFLEKVSENIASSIIFSKNHDQTSKLLRDSQMLTEQLRAQEEEMRQNMEELQATQEDLQRKNVEMETAQKELSEERYLMEALMKNTTDYIYFKDLKSCFIRVSNTMATAFKVSGPKDMAGKSDFDFFTKEHALPAYNDEQKIIRTGVPIVDLVEKETWEDGRESYVSTTKMPLRDLNGTVVGTFGTSRDITKSKKTEAELLRKEKLYSVLLKNSSEIYFIVDDQGKLKFISPSYFRILEKEEQDLTGQKLIEIISSDDSGGFENAFSKSKSSETIIESSFKLLKSNNEHIQFQILMQNYLNEENVNGILINARLKA